MTRWLLAALSLPEWRAHPWRQGVALLAVALGVALAYSVQLLNDAALAQFSAASRAAGGEPDLTLRAARGDSFDEALFAAVATDPRVALAGPVVEATTQALAADGSRVPLRILGVDTLVVASLAPDLLPRVADGADRLALLHPDRIFLNPAARQRLGDAGPLRLAAGDRLVTLQRDGSVNAAGPPLAVMDIAGAQALFGPTGRLHRVDLRLAEGADRRALIAALPPGLRVAGEQEAEARASAVSRAYRVNLTVLALVALFTGGFLVFSVQALSVARRLPAFALLGVLGLSGRERRRLVLTEAALVGFVGSALGLALGAALAALALRLLGGDLGGGYFRGLTPTLQATAGPALAYFALGLLAALAGAWVPARQAEAIAPAQALKGLGLDGAVGRRWRWLGPALLVAALGLALLPPWRGLPLGAYLAVAAGLLGGIVCVPAVVGALLAVLPSPRGALPLLALERARQQRLQASVAVAGVVAALSLGVALLVMVASFRLAVADWLDRLLPADVYARSVGAGGPEAGGGAGVLPPGLLAHAADLPGVRRVEGQRTQSVVLDPAQPPLAIVARPLADARRLPLVGEQRPAPPGELGVYASEAVAALYGVGPGGRLALPLAPDRPPLQVTVLGLWRDYARQHGALLVDLADWQRATGDTRLTDLALWLQTGADADAVQAGLRQGVADPALLETASTAEIRAQSLRLFDRSFAVTRYLQAVALFIGLFGVAASFSGQVLARRKEFGTLAHLGVTRRQLLALVAAEGALWTGAGAVLGVVLGLAVSVVLVHVVNPQSFRWTMDLHVPWAPLAALAAAVVVAGTLTAALAGRAAASRELALSVKEDW
ncbi:FtsX-like permease family protein [Aquabacterium sp. J223]|uniref:FtsX-like permease family protein n=1 Tax=Aquabacterium sp. J223 TaxID=2898431 RepID=UPI0021AE2301|nr:FtsX-like permease family protein [Aquabacterium sp. J223]UUX94846.1 FtsX-like permease family protein [Aquabacterium sp. J223]